MKTTSIFSPIWPIPSGWRDATAAILCPIRPWEVSSSIRLEITTRRCPAT